MNKVQIKARDGPIYPAKERESILFKQAVDTLSCPDERWNTERSLKGDHGEQLATDNLGRPFKAESHTTDKQQ
jgi:hypothetical protein